MGGPGIRATEILVALRYSVYAAPQIVDSSAITNDYTCREIEGARGITIRIEQTAFRETMTYIGSLILRNSEKLEKWGVVHERYCSGVEHGLVTDNVSNGLYVLIVAAKVVVREGYTTSMKSLQCSRHALASRCVYFILSRIRIRKAERI